MKKIIHIGMGRAASTSIQIAFEKHPEIILDAGSSLHHKLLSNSIKNISDSNTEINIDSGAKKIKCIAYSCENIGFPVPILTEFDFKPLKNFNAEKYHENAVILLKEIIPEAEILIIERDKDESFYRSQYDFAVKTGCTISYKDYKNFFLINKEFLDVQKIKSYYEKFFKVHILKFDQLKNNPEEFKIQLSKILNVNTEELNLNKENSSYLENEIYYHLILNKILFFLFKNLKIFGEKFYRKILRYKRFKKIFRLLKYIPSPKIYSWLFKFMIVKVKMPIYH